MIYYWLILVVVVCYFIGNVSFARVFAKLFKHEDITQKGSGNPGTMNMLRVYGIGYALLTLLFDALKAGVAAMVCGYIFAPYGLFELAFLVAGTSVVVGHNFPVIYKFKGGKGVASLFGIFLFSPLWYVGIIMFFICAIFLYFVDYAFLASLIFVFALGIAWIVRLAILQPMWWWICIILIAFNLILCVIMHRANITRFVKGTENATNFKQKVNKLFGKKEKVEEAEIKPEKEIVITEAEQAKAEEEAKRQKELDKEEDQTEKPQ